MNLLLTLCLLLCFASLILAAAPATQAVPGAEHILDSLKREHPRLIVSQADLDRLRAKLKTDDAFAAAARKLIGEADKVCTEQPSQYEIPDGKRLLATSRRVLARVQALAIAYHLTLDRKYVERAWDELDAAAKFKDWNPSHFLDTAEMTNAFALGYDWLYHQWSPEQRKAIREAIIKHGLNVGLEAYTAEKPAWWTRAEHNWNQVCNGGLLMGALAIADEEPKLASQIIREAVTRYPLALKHYGPDGAWNEGPGYWHYATRYTVPPLSAMESALGTDFGLSEIPGVDKAGVYAVHIVGPSGLAFNYADGSASWGGSPDLWWLARRFDQPLLARAQEKYATKKPMPLDLVWGDFSTPADLPAGTPTDAYFRAAEFVTMRTAWADPDAMFVGLKAGDNKANHSNLDLGSFVLDALGQRFVVDLGPDNYNLPQYFGKLRWTYYRLRAEGHNTLVIGQPDPETPDQDPKANVPITQFDSTANRAFAITDLSKAYAHASHLTRGVWMDKQAMTVLVQDEIKTTSPQPVWWSAHTPAEIAISENGRSAVLGLKDKTIRVRLLAPTTAVFTARDATPLPGAPNPDGQNPNKGLRKLVIELNDVTEMRIAVLFEAGDGFSKAVVPLSDWK
jgi:hypothetical protein